MWDPVKRSDRCSHLEPGALRRAIQTMLVAWCEHDGRRRVDDFAKIVLPGLACAIVAGLLTIAAPGWLAVLNGHRVSVTVAIALAVGLLGWRSQLGIAAARVTKTPDEED